MKNVVQYRLLRAGDDTPRTVRITPTPPAVRVPKLPPENQERVEAGRAAATCVSVSERLVRPHAIIAGWLAGHERRKQSRGHSDPWTREMLHPAEPGNLDRRQLLILDALLKELERRGGRAKEGKHGELSVEITGEPIEFQLREKLKQVRRPLTAEEKRWRLGGDRDWKQELQPSGKLVFAIKTYLPRGLRAEWLETDSKPMESLLPEVVAFLIAAGPMLAEQRRRREEEEHRRYLAEQQRREEQQRLKLDSNRWRRFVEIAHRWRDAEVARQFIEALKNTDPGPEQQIDGKSVVEWIVWAERRLLTMDPLVQGPTHIFSKVAETTTWSYHD